MSTLSTTPTEGGVEEDGAQIEVAVRFRPRLEKNFASKTQSRWRREQAFPLVHDGQRRFLFDHVFGPTHCNAEVSTTVAARVVEKVLDGYNGTIIAYGQAGSGKTHTMSAAGGMVEFCVMALFSGLARAQTRPRVRLSTYEIYNERILDLLGAGGDNKAARLSAQDDHLDCGSDERGLDNEPQVASSVRMWGDDASLGAPTMEGLSEVEVDSPHDALSLLARADLRRHTRETASSPRSSRSHTVVRIAIDHGVTQADVPVSASLNLVDLAASERSATTESDALLETSHLNRSLLALREVVSSLTASQLQPQFVPYRNSLLTRALRQSLGGNAYTSVICTASEAAEDDPETETSLVFGSLCRRIPTAPSRVLTDKRAVRSPRGRRGDDSLEETKAADAEGSRESEQDVREEYQRDFGDAFGDEDGNGENDENEDEDGGLEEEDNDSGDGDDERSKGSEGNESDASAGDQQPPARRDSIFSIEPHSDSDHRLQDIKSWEREMRQWYTDSVEYNEETQERAQLVEAAAERVARERRDRAMSLARREAVFVADMRRRRSELDSMKMQLERAEQDVLNRRETLLLRETAARALEHSLQRWQARLESQEADMQALREEAAQYRHQRDESRSLLEQERQRAMATTRSRARRMSAPAPTRLGFGLVDIGDDDMSPTLSPHLQQQQLTEIPDGFDALRLEGPASVLGSPGKSEDQNDAASSVCSPLPASPRARRTRIGREGDNDEDDDDDDVDDDNEGLDAEDDDDQVEIAGGDEEDDEKVNAGDVALGSPEVGRDGHAAGERRADLKGSRGDAKREESSGAYYEEGDESKGSQDHEEEKGFGGDMQDILFGLTEMSSMSSHMASDKRATEHAIVRLSQVLGKILLVVIPVLARNPQTCAEAASVGSPFSLLGNDLPYKRRLLRRHLSEARQVLVGVSRRRQRSATRQNETRGSGQL